MMFDIKEVCNPCNVEEARKHEGKKGWFADSVKEIKKTVAFESESGFGKMDIPYMHQEFPYRLLNKRREHFRYFYPAPEKKYRPFTGEELADLPGRYIRNDLGELHMIEEYCKRFYRFRAPYHFVRVFDKKIEFTSEILFMYWTFKDGTPCGVEVE